jgi:hypothetical protein
VAERTVGITTMLHVYQAVFTIGSTVRGYDAIRV